MENSPKSFFCFRTSFKSLKLPCIQKGITKHRDGLEFEFKFELDFELDSELQFELILSIVTTISDTLRILQATCLMVRFISNALEHLVNQGEIKHQS